MSFTPGPWKIDASGAGCIQILTADGKRIIAKATTSGAGVKHKSATSRDNAKLIAAAPEMLRALQNLLKCESEEDLKKLKLTCNHIIAQVCLSNKMGGEK